MNVLNEEIEVLFSRRLITQAARLYWKKLFLSKRIIIPLVTVSIGFVSTWGYKVNGERINMKGVLVGCVVIGLLWAAWGYTYLKIVRRTLAQFKPLLGHTVRLALRDSGITVSSGDYRKEISWFDLDRFIEAPDMVFLYSSKGKGCFFFPNVEFSDKIKARMEGVRANNVQ
jgi:hypothetical protein